MSGTEGIRSKRTACSCAICSKWARMKSSCPSGVPRTVMPCSCVGRINRPSPHCGMVWVHSTGSSVQNIATKRPDPTPPVPDLGFAIMHPDACVPPELCLQCGRKPQTPDQEHTPPKHRPSMRTRERSPIDLARNEELDVDQERREEAS